MKTTLRDLELLAIKIENLLIQAESQHRKLHTLQADAARTYHMLRRIINDEIHWSESLP